jgi:heme exporter protein D
MNLELLFLNGYGQFVWPAFIFTFSSLFYLFIKTSKELKKQEELFFKDFKQLKTIKIQVEKIKIQKKILLPS